jgi:ribonuclease G
VPIERQVFEGQTLTVQVIKDAIGTKGARLSTQVSIAGRMLVFLPHDNHIGISQKIGSPELREQLRTRMQALVGKPEEGGGGGFILRTNAEEATDTELADDIAYLRKRLGADPRQGAEQAAGHAAAPGPEPGRARAARPGHRQHADHPHRQPLQCDALKAFGETYMPGTVAKLELYRASGPSSTCSASRKRLSRALARRVDLKSGGYLIFDQTEALTTVDVNTGGYVGARNFDDTIFKTNLEAAGAIARQLRLRNLGGIIIVDFIDMAREDHQQAVLAELRKQLAATACAPR